MQVFRISDFVTRCWYGQQQQGKKAAQGRQDGKKDSEISHFFRQKSSQWWREYEKDGNNGIDHGHFLHVKTQTLHMEVEIGVKDGHGGRLKEEDELDPH